MSNSTSDSWRHLVGLPQSAEVAVCVLEPLSRDPQYGESFINGPMGHALGYLSTTFETANPFATPAAGIRIVQIDHLYLKSMVMAGDPRPYAPRSGSR